MAEEYVIGIDSGTQSTRAILFNLKGEKIASASATHPALMTDERGLIVHDYQDVYQGLCTACQILIEKIKKIPKLQQEQLKLLALQHKELPYFFWIKKGNNYAVQSVGWIEVGNQMKNIVINGKTI